jgi:Beta/Gamma crystallin
MTRLLQHLVFGTSVLVASSAMADVTFYENDNFSGRQFSVGQATPNFRDSGMNDRAQSAVVEGSNWEVCIDREFGGGCTVLAPGRYPNLGGWSRLISSARPTGASPPSAGPVAQAPAQAPSQATAQAPAATYPAYAQRGNITFYGTENFGGRQMTADRSLPNFGGTGFNDRTYSAIIEGGSWEVCSGPGFGGNCTVLAPGRYPALAGWSGNISSARPVSDPRAEMTRDRMRGRASATLYSEPNLTGRQFALGGEGATNLDGQFNDRASSLRVERGYWIFCSDTNYRGECWTFGPGDYPNLPAELNNRISSGRRISNDYPYSRQTSAR